MNATSIPLIVTPLNSTEVLVTGPVSLQEWRDTNTIDVPGAEFSAAYKRGHWDGKWTPGKWCRLRADGVYELRCSRGLLPRVYEALGYSARATFLNSVDGTKRSALVFDYLAQHRRGKELTDYQTSGIHDAFMFEWARLAFATNAGKGAMIALLADLVNRSFKESVLVLCDEISVYDALLGELAVWGGFQPFCVRQGVKEPPSKKTVTLAMVQTLAKRLKQDPDLWKPWLKSQSMLLLDEADKATADTWTGICKAASGATWRVGFSGTFPSALTYDDWQLEELMGPIVATIKNMELIDRGISARPKVELRGFDTTSGFGRLPDWDSWKAMTAPGRRLWAYEQAIIYNTARHAFVRSLIRPGQPTAVIVNRVAHGAALTEEIPGAVFLDGSLSETQRRHALEAFREGHTPVIVVTKILDRGTNRLGHATDLIFASSEGSDRQTLQRVGRGLRRADGKAFLRLVDIIDRVADDEDRRMSKAASFIADAGSKRLELYQAEGFEVEVIP